MQRLMGGSPVARNQIAAISGLSNPYIRDLEMGNIANVGREKLISLAIGLDLSLGEIDEMLTVFDRAKLTQADIPLFLEASRRSRISAALHPVHDSYTFDLLLLSAEQVPGPHVIVSTRPEELCQPRPIVSRRGTAIPLHDKVEAMCPSGREQAQYACRTCGRPSTSSFFVCSPRTLDL